MSGEPPQTTSVIPEDATQPTDGGIEALSKKDLGSSVSEILIQGADESMFYSEEEKKKERMKKNTKYRHAVDAYETEQMALERSIYFGDEKQKEEGASVLKRVEETTETARKIMENTTLESERNLGIAAAAGKGALGGAVAGAPAGTIGSLMGAVTGGTVEGMAAYQKSIEQTGEEYVSRVRLLSENLYDTLKLTGVMKVQHIEMVVQNFERFGMSTWNFYRFVMEGISRLEAAAPTSRILQVINIAWDKVFKKSSGASQGAMQFIASNFSSTGTGLLTYIGLYSQQAPGWLDWLFAAAGNTAISLAGFFTTLSAPGFMLLFINGVSLALLKIDLGEVGNVAVKTAALTSLGGSALAFFGALPSVVAGVFFASLGYILNKIDHTEEQAINFGATLNQMSIAFQGTKSAALEEFSKKTLQMSAMLKDNDGVKRYLYERAVQQPSSWKRNFEMNSGGRYPADVLMHQGKTGPFKDSANNTLGKAAIAIAHGHGMHKPVTPLQFARLLAKSVHPSVAYSGAATLKTKGTTHNHLETGNEHDTLLMKIRFAHAIHTIRAFLNRDTGLHSAEIFQFMVIFEHEPLVVSMFGQAIKSFKRAENLGTYSYPVLRDFAILTQFYGANVPLIFDKWSFCTDFIERFIQEHHSEESATYIIEPVVEACQRILDLMKAPVHSVFAHQQVEANYEVWWRHPFHKLETTPIQ